MTRTLLFDVDQTLLYTGGAGGLGMARAFQQLYGVENAFEAIEASGRTDWSILKRGLQQHGLHDQLADFPRTLSTFIDTYLEHLPGALEDAPGGHIKPGVPELLNALAKRAETDDIKLGIATGNFRRSCLLKLEFFELNAHLKEGGFGEDAEDRGDMVAVALQRVSNGVGASAPPGRPSAWIIGDTPRDVESAIANDANSLAVATGANTVDELIAAGATVALEDLADVDHVLDILLG